MRLEFPEFLDATWLDEHAPETASPGPSQLELGGEGVDVAVQHWRRSRLLAEARLLGVLRAVEQRGAGVRIELGYQLPAIDEAPEHRAWELWRDTLGAILLAERAESIRGPDGTQRRTEVRETQHAQLRAHGGQIGDGSHRALLAFDEALDAPAPPRLLGEATTPPARRRLVDATLRRVAGRALNLGPVRRDHLAALVDFVAELIDNTVDHAVFDAADARIRGSRFLLVRRMNLARDPPETLAAAASISALGAFLEDIEPLWAETRPAERKLVEVTVADSGVGIAGRLGANLDVYLDSLADETKLLVDAMDAGVSSKPPPQGGAGLGLWKVANATTDLHGMMVVRSGRLQISRSATSHSGGWEVEERGYQVGTAVSVLWPWREVKRGASS